MGLTIEEYYESRKKIVDEAVREYLRKNNLEKIGETAMGGKRLRGVLVILVGEALGVSNSDMLRDMAIAVELAHAASLDADDIVDLDQLRRGKPAKWVVEGVLKTVLGTHALVSHALNIVNKYGKEYVDIFVDTYTKMVRGELLDVNGSGPYETIIALKTAALWAAAAAAATLASGKREYVEYMRNYGLYTGIAFQIADDAVDVYKIVEKFELSKLLQPSTLAFLTYLGLRTLIETSPLEVFRRGFSTLKDKAMRIIAEKIDIYVQKARDEVNKIPDIDSEYKTLLLEYPRFCVEMMFREGGLI